MADAQDKKEDDKQPSGHSMADHTYGNSLEHEHEGGEDHDHDHFEFDDDGPIEQNPIWLQDHVTLVSVGIDIGSSGTQVIFSRINLRRYGEDLTSRYYVVSRETLYQSPVALTPYSSEERIDDRGLGKIIDDAYAGAGLHPDQIDTGAVILTGEALRRENAEGIAKILSEQGGEFVCATAGHHMESMLAAYGSGASRVSHDEDKRVLNIDIGGGTTKLALVEKGHVDRDRGGAYRRPPAGGRSQDRSHRTTRPGRALPCPAGRASTGTKVTPSIPTTWTRSPRVMAGELVAALTERPMPHAVEHLYLTDLIADFGRIDGMMFSGGVGEYVYGREERDFGDMGRRLGHGDPPQGRCRRVAMAAADRRRMHPRHRARRLRIQRPAQRQYQLYQQARRAPAAPQPAGGAAAVRMRRGHRSRRRWRNRSAAISRPST